MNMIGFGVILAATIGSCLQSTRDVPGATEKEIQKAYTDLTSADHWRKAKGASDRLSKLGEPALPTILKGAKHEKKMVREYCYQVLCSQFPKHEKSIKAIIDGLDDKESMISYSCAFHLGENRISQGRKALKACLKGSTKDNMTRYAAAKSLAQLGDLEVTVMLYTGLGSEDHYTRYLSNTGMKALCGKDLSDFGYQGPWEGAFVSGPHVGRGKGQPIEKAKKRVERWRAIVKFLQWLKTEKPKLYKELDNLQ